MNKKTILLSFLCAGVMHFITLPMSSGLSFGSSIFAADFKSDINPFPFAARPAEGTIADCSYMNQPITEQQRISVGDDGHLYANGKRIRIFGTNISNFPAVEDAEYWAKTIAAQGYNCVRFHHTDSDWAECFFTHDKSWKTVSFDESSFERFDKFFYELKKAGVYSNINLLTGRTIKADEENGLPDELNKVADWKDRHCYGFWNELAREEQKKYAEKILTHKNSYTGLTYAEDPAVVFVEINNENSMTKCYLDNALTRFPSSLTQELDFQWTNFLAQKGWTYNKLDKTFNQKEALGENLIKGKGNFEQHDSAKATLTEKNGYYSIQVTANGKESWHIQYSLNGFVTQAEQLYTISFKAKASKDSKLSVSVNMNHAPWSGLGFSKNINLTKDWQDFSFCVSSLQEDSNPRLVFGNMGMSSGTIFEFSDIVLCKGGSTLAVEKADPQLVGANKPSNTLIKFPISSEQYHSLPLELRLLVTEFIVALDDDYWGSMNDYLKKDLHIKALTFGTALTCAPITVMNKFDVIDSHAYWHHPTFPGSGWNSKDFYVKNQSLVTDDNGGTLAELAKLRIYGKPFSVTEYDHPYPSQFSAEMMPMLAVMASLQDWDCVYSFCYEISQKNPDKMKITGYFDQANNPAKIAGVPVAARIFREFRIKPFENAVAYTVTPKTELKAIAQRGGAWNNVPQECFGANQKDALFYRLGGFVKADDEVESGTGDTDGETGARDEANAIAAEGVKVGSADSASSAANEAPLFAFDWNSRYGYFVYSDDDVFVSVTTTDAGRIMGLAKLREKLQQTMKAPWISFLPDDDFATVAGVKLKDSDSSRWFIFSCSWSGNLGEKLYEYGKKPSIIPANSITRSVANLTTEYSGSGVLAAALGSRGALVIQEGDIITKGSEADNSASSKKAGNKASKAGKNANKKTGKAGKTNKEKTAFASNAENNNGWKIYSLNPDGSRKNQQNLFLSEKDQVLWYELEK